MDKDLARHEDAACVKRQPLSSEVQYQRTISSLRMEAEDLAERWGCELSEVDAGSGGANHALSSLLREIEETRRNKGSGIVYAFSKMKPPQRLLIWRTVVCSLPDALVKVFAR